MSDKEDTSKSDAQDASLTDEETESVQGGAAAAAPSESLPLASEGKYVSEG
ncbi:MAG: hypothetical protein U0904_03925 [Candidatus Nanopelagicales bacterium]|nr:hypothetical protein [Candidatus Nanopelagicales bacterium]